MQIKEIQIDGFGVFSNKQVKGLTSGLNVVYGPNEFGKTTLLEFIRRMMFGFPRKNPKVNHYQPVQGGRMGGALKCVLASGQLVSIVREAGNKDGPVIRTDSLENRGQSYLDSFLGHASKEIFQNIYAFTIDELQDVQSLRGDEIKSHIYGAGMGLGEVSLGDIEKWLDKSCGEIFKPRGTGGVAVILSEINKIENGVRKAQAHLEKFDELTLLASRLDDEKSTLRKTIGDLELAKKVLETRQELYPIVIEILNAQEEIGGIEDVPGFPENGMQKLTSIQSDKENLLNRIQEEERSYDELQINLRNLSVNNELLGHEGDILFLQQSLKEVQSAIADQMKVKNDWEHMSDQIQIETGTVGQDWTEEKIMDFQLTEMEKNEIHEFYNALSEFGQNVYSAQDKLDLHREQKEANKPEPPASVPTWMRQLPYGLGGVGLAGVVTGLVMGDAILFGVFFVMTVLGAVFYKKITVKPKDEVELDDKLEISLAKRLDKAIEKRETTFESWRSWLKARELDEGLAPLVTEKIGDRVREIKSMMAQRDDLSERLGDMRKTIEGVSQLVEKIAPSLQYFTINSDVPTNIQIIGRYFDEARLVREKKELFEIQCREQTEKIDGLKSRVSGMDNDLSEFLRSSSAVDEKDFIEKHNILDRKKNLSRIVEEKKGYVQSRVGLENSYDVFVESVKSASQEENQQKLDDVSGRLSELNGDKDRLLQAIGETRTRIDQLSSDDDFSKKQVELEMGRQKLKEYAREWAINRVALQMLSRARKKYEKERQPAVIKAAEEMFTQITRSNYIRIFKPMDSDDILIDDGSERAKGLLEMSRGTREQLYLAMRFGLIEEYETRSEPLPVIMDDVFVNFDDDRNDQMIGLVRHFAKPRQVVVLTCHKRIFEAYSARGANPITVG